MSKLQPEIGQWYQDVAADVLFKVVAFDEASGSTEIQYFDGAVSELEEDTWREMVLLTAEAPEDWRGSYELSPEDETEDDDIQRPDGYDDPLAKLDLQ